MEFEIGSFVLINSFWFKPKEKKKTNYICENKYKRLSYLKQSIYFQ